MAAKPKTHSEYLAAVSPEHRAALNKLRKQIKAAAPKAQECINYGVPAFKLSGKAIAGYSASKNHCTFFPMDGHTVAAFKKELAAFEASKGAIRFQPEKPLPAALVRKIVKSRVAEVDSRVKTA